jgi:diacylglycerol kinase (ATP)
LGWFPDIPEMSRICVIFNPAARGEKALRFRAHLVSLSHQCSLKPTIGIGSATRLAAEAVRQGFETIVAAGGDGTVNEVLNGLCATRDGPARARFAVLPLGTVNVFAKELNLPSRFAEAWPIILAGRESMIDLPFAEFTADGLPQKRYFAQMAGAGLDSRAVELINWEEKKKFGSLAYVFAALRARRGRMPQVVVANGEQTITGELVLIGNGRFYGGRYAVFPKADLRDALLEVSIFPKVDLEGAIRSSWGLLTNQLYTTGGVRHLKAESLSLYSADPVPFHLDGENVGPLPVKFGLHPRALRVVVP